MVVVDYKADVKYGENIILKHHFLFNEGGQALERSFLLRRLLFVTYGLNNLMCYRLANKKSD